jgi:ABC-2 type transport system permease protein
MLEVTRFELQLRARGTVVAVVLVGVTVGLNMGVYPSLESADVDWDAVVESFPEEIRTAFLGSVTDLTTIEGYLVSQFYQLIWLLFVGGYLAYAAASAVAGEVEGRSVDVLLTRPLSRTRLVVEKFLALAVVSVVVNAGTLVAVAASVALVGEWVPPADLLLTHAVTGVYLLACVAVGLVASVLFTRPRRAGAVALGAVFASYLLDTLTRDTDYEWLGWFSLTRYVDPGDLLVRTDVDAGGVAVLVVVTCGLVVLAAELLERRDVPG